MFKELTVIVSKVNIKIKKNWTCGRQTLVIHVQLLQVALKNIFDLL